MKTVRFITLGCKVNQYDSEAMLELFCRAGYRPALNGERADVSVVNTCTVTGTGDKKSLQTVRRCIRENPEGDVVVTGCLAQRMGEELLETGARLVLGTQNRARVVELLHQAISENRRLAAVEALKDAVYEPLFITRHEGHTRAVMKIQEGCDNRCAYCIIPSVRGGVRSRDVFSIENEARALAQAGFREIVLTGIHLTSYGKDMAGQAGLLDAVRAVASQEGIERIRLGSLEPVIATEAFADALSGIPKLCPQFHLALQSGSDAVLARMRRRYNTAQFMKARDRILRALPDATFTTDVIVGFPGETEEDFEQTLRFCDQIGFLKIHVFPYSRRAGTEADAMTGQVSKAVKEERVRRLIALGDQLSIAVRERFLDTVQPVLIEEKLHCGRLAGYTPQYIRVELDAGEPDSVQYARLTELLDEGMKGIPVIAPKP